MYIGQPENSQIRIIRKESALNSKNIEKLNSSGYENYPVQGMDFTFYFFEHPILQYLFRRYQGNTTYIRRLWIYNSG